MVFASWFLSRFQFIEAQLEYHKKAVTVLDNILPNLKQLLGKLRLFCPQVVVIIVFTTVK